MKLTRIDEWIKACEELIGAYAGKTAMNVYVGPICDCPLCEVSHMEGYNQGGEEFCVCLWKFFEGRDCQHDGGMEILARDRIERLRGWIEKLKEIKNDK